MILKLRWRLPLGHLLLLSLVAAGTYLVLRTALAAYLHQALAAMGPDGDQVITGVTAMLRSGLGVTVMAFFLLACLWDRKALAPLAEMVRITGRLARGDLEQRVEIRSADELGEVGRNVGEMVHRFQGVVKDISREKRKVDTILTGMSEGVLAIDQVGRLLLMNRAAEEILAAQADTMLGRYLVEVIRSPELAEGVRQVLDSGEQVTRELKLYPALPQIFIVHITPVLDVERVVGAVLVLRDVTKLRRLEQVRTEFVANVSHELRTPLTSIKGFVETLLEGAMEDQEAARRFLLIIDAETKRLQRLIDDLLFLSRMENKRFERPTDGAFVAVVGKKAMALLGPLADERHVALQFHLPEDLPEVRMGEDLLSQVLINLVENSLKYTPAGGRVDVRARVQDGKVQVEVTDTGVGIPMESLPRIFERFYRVDRARSRQMGGTGLGLAIVKHVVESHGGTVTVGSQVGRGSTFTFSVPGVPDGD